MNKANHKKILSNRASQIENFSQNDCENCFEQFIFALKDSQGTEFCVGLSTILGCLKLAEQQYAIPIIDESWWCKIINMYDLYDIKGKVKPFPKARA